MWIRSHVELLLQDEWEVCRVTVDGDGDFAFRSGTAVCWVSVLDSSPAMVRVFAHAAVDVVLAQIAARAERGAALGGVRTVDLAHGIVVVSQTVSPIGLTGPVLVQATSSVGTLADEIGGLVAAMHDGATPFEALLEIDEEAS